MKLARTRVRGKLKNSTVDVDLLRVGEQKTEPGLSRLTLLNAFCYKANRTELELKNSKLTKLN